MRPHTVEKSAGCAGALACKGTTHTGDVVHFGHPAAPFKLRRDGKITLFQLSHRLKSHQHHHCRCHHHRRRRSATQSPPKNTYPVGFTLSLNNRTSPALCRVVEAVTTEAAAGAASAKGGVCGKGRSLWQMKSLRYASSRQGEEYIK